GDRHGVRPGPLDLRVAAGGRAATPRDLRDPAVLDRDVVGRDRDLSRYVLAVDDGAGGGDIDAAGWRQGRSGGPSHVAGSRVGVATRSGRHEAVGRRRRRWRRRRWRGRRWWRWR